MSVSSDKVYRPRGSRGSKFYTLLSEHFEEFLNIYDSRFRRQYGYLRPVISEAVYKYLDCGDLSKGFARVRCESCGDEYLVSFSCKIRYFCPSCHQKRVLILGEFLRECVLTPSAHRQIVFTIPKMLLKEGKINEETVRLIRSWRHSGFNVGNHVHIGHNNPAGLEGLIQYIVRAPLSQEKILLAESEDKIIYRSRLNPSIKRNFRIFDPPRMDSRHNQPYPRQRPADGKILRLL